jgi:hypothetical protein
MNNTQERTIIFVVVTKVFLSKRQDETPLFYKERS